MKTGEDVLGVIARSGKHFIPEPGDGIIIEHEFGGPSIVNAFDTWREIKAVMDPNDSEDRHEADAWYKENIGSALVAAGVPFVGYIDLVNLRDYWIDNEGHRRSDPPRTKEVCDWKTTKSIEDYAKPGYTLIDTVQMIGYAEYLSREWPDTENFRLSHGYFQTQGRASLKTTTRISLETVKERWQNIESTVRSMIDVAQEVDDKKVEPNYDSCAAYGGCSYRHLCPRSNEQVIADLFGGKKGMGLLSKLNSKLKSASPEASNGSNGANGANGISAPTHDSDVAAEVAKLKAEESAIKTPPGNIIAEVTASLAASSNGLAAVRPPDAPASTPPGNAEPIPPGTVLPPAVAAAVAAHASTLPAPPAPPSTPEASTPATGTATAEGTKRRGRPLGSKNKSSEAPAAPATASGAPPAALVATLGGTVAGASSPSRVNLPLRHRMVVQNRATGLKLRIYGVTDPDTGEKSWYQGPDSDDPIVAHELSGTKPEQWFSDVWSDVTPATGDAPPTTASTSPAAPSVAASTPSLEAPTTATHAGPPAAASTPSTGFLTPSVVAGTSAPSSSPHSAVRLFVDVVVSGLTLTDLEPWIAEVAKEVSAAAGLPDMRLAGPEHTLGYGRWKAALTAAIRAVPPPPGDYTITDVRESEVKQVVIEALRPICAVCVRAR